MLNYTKIEPIQNFCNIVANGFVYVKLRVCARGISEGNSDVVNLQRPLARPKLSNYFYTLLAFRFSNP